MRARRFPTPYGRSGATTKGPDSGRSERGRSKAKAARASGVDASVFTHRLAPGLFESRQEAHTHRARFFAPFTPNTCSLTKHATRERPQVSSADMTGDDFKPQTRRERSLQSRCPADLPRCIAKDRLRLARSDDLFFDQMLTPVCAAACVGKQPERDIRHRTMRHPERRCERNCSQLFSEPKCVAVTFVARPAGLEPATSWLVARQNGVSRPLRRVAARCEPVYPAPNSLMILRFRPAPLFAAVCRPLLQPKGNKRATLQKPVSW